MDIEQLNICPIIDLWTGTVTIDDFGGSMVQWPFKGFVRRLD
jgi:hypothetical protein